MRKKKSKKNLFAMRAIAVFLTFCLIMCNDCFCNRYTAMAAESKAGKFGFTKTSISLYVGNIYQLETVNAEEYDWYSPYYDSSDSNIVRVDSNGQLRAVGVGKADITAWFEGQTAVCHVNVKPSHSEVDKPKITLYEGEKTTIKLTDSKQKAARYDYFICDAEYGSENSYALNVESEGKGVFTVEGMIKGKYYLDLSLTNKRGNSYSARCEVEVLECGFASNRIAVAKGETIKLNPVNAEVVFCEFLYDYDLYDDEEYEKEIELGENGEITGITEGETTIYVGLKTAYGEDIATYIYVCVTDPQYIPFEGRLFAGEAYSPQFEGTSYYSNIEVSASDEEFIDKWSSGNYISIYPKKSGTVTLEFNVDGRKFSQEVEIIAPKLNVNDYAFIKKGKSKLFEFSDLPNDCKVKWNTSDKKVAAVSSKGKVTGKETGNALITATVEGKTFYIAVTVVNNKEYAVALKAEKAIGAEYSQEKRMQKGFYDCSSLVWRSYNDAGIKICNLNYAPTAANLAKILEKEGKAIAYEYIEPDKLRTGDLIFYSAGPNGRYKDIYHVAMYLGAYYTQEGENYGMIIEARGAGVVLSWYEFDYYGISMIARPMQ